MSENPEPNPEPKPEPGTAPSNGAEPDAGAKPERAAGAVVPPPKPLMRLASLTPLPQVLDSVASVAAVFASSSVRGAAGPLASPKPPKLEPLGVAPLVRRTPAVAVPGATGGRLASPKPVQTFAVVVAVAVVTSAALLSPPPPSASPRWLL